jgi:hypothetical protein
MMVHVLALGHEEITMFCKRVRKETVERDGLES